MFTPGFGVVYRSSAKDAPRIDIFRASCRRGVQAAWSVELAQQPQREKESSMRRILCLSIVITLFVPLAFVRCAQSAEQDAEPFRYTSFRDVPGVTEAEIQAIEGLQKRGTAFVYGMLLTTETFYDENGVIRGFSALFGEWLTEFFGIPFTPAIYSWGDLLRGLASGAIDFSGELAASEQRKGSFFMTDAIAERSVKYIRRVGSDPLYVLALQRPLCYAFLKGSDTAEEISAYMQNENFSIFWADDCDQVYAMLKNGQIDAFYGEGVEASFDVFADVAAYDLYPKFYAPVSLSTQNPELQPIISVMQKFLALGGERPLSELYTAGYQEYLRYKLFRQFTMEERAYIQNNPVVRFAAEFDNYPTCFYDVHKGKWQGISIEFLNEVEKLTGLSFKIINDERTDWNVLKKMLEDGEASMISELIRTEERMGKFLWPERVVYTDYPALLSGIDFRDVRLNEVLLLRVGLIEDDAQVEIFHKWFPGHMYTAVYANSAAALHALERGEIDLLMSSQNSLLMYTHYFGYVGYKVNILFNHPFGSTFGFHREETVLCSIIDKALGSVDLDFITNKWMNKNYDYRTQLTEARFPLLIGSSVLLMSVLILLTIFFMRKNTAGKQLEALVHERTMELENSQIRLESALQAAETANRTKSAFLANVSHEMRTPLNAILGISEVQSHKETLSPETEEAFGRIFNSGDLLLGIINDILDMSKIEAGKLKLKLAQYDVASLINDTVFLNMIKYESKPIEFTLNLDENIPSILFGDELRIKQILNNVLSNAFKYTSAGTVELSVASRPADSSAGDTALIFRVRDTGAGMSEEQVARLFDDYTRFHEDGANRMTEGTGLGMSITRNLVQMMKGEIQVESTPGRGSLFTVSLPQGSVAAPAIDKEAAERLRRFRTHYEVKIKKSVIRSEISFGRVLVVDDVNMNLYVARGMLSLYGLQIDTAASGPEAIEMVKENAYDLVFMDHMMPKMDGMEAAQEIRKLGEVYQKLPIVVLTANAISGMKEMFLANGFDDFVSKPIDLQELDTVLKKWMSSEKIVRSTKPEEMAVTADTKNEAQDTFWDELGKIGEISIEMGLRPFEGMPGKEEMYRKLLVMFQKRLVSDCSAMTGFLENKDIKSFSIAVHAMKSLLATIGAREFSEAALALEMAAKKQEMDFCAGRYPALREELLSLHRRLSALFPSEEVAPQKKPGDTHMLRESLSKALAAAEELDDRAGKESITHLLAYDFSGEINALLKDAVSAFEKSEITGAFGALQKIEMLLR